MVLFIFFVDDDDNDDDHDHDDNDDDDIFSNKENTNMTGVVKLVETTTITPHPDDPKSKTLMTTDCNMNLKSNFWGKLKIDVKKQVCVRFFPS